VKLEAVVGNLHGIAAAGQLSASRLPALFLTFDRNRQWWTTGPLLSSGQRVEFAGSQLVWEYYAGQGIELQVLGTFGKADGLYTGGAHDSPQMRQLLSEMIPLAAQRGGGLTWEYYFHFDGGSPPWTSTMSQGTALEALTRASKAFGQSSGSGGAGYQPPSSLYLQIAQRALPIFTVPPPVGVRVATPLGARYLQYSFTPGTDIINAFLQSLIGLYDYAHVSDDREAQRLFAAGDAQARAELPRFDSGGWSLYQPGVEDTVDYHTLVTGFLDQLCTRTGAPVYCTTAQRFHADLTTPPALQLLTTQSAPKTPFAVRFRLSKYAHVGIVVVRGGTTVFLTSGYFSNGVNAFELPPLPAGSCTVRLAATDLPGNFNRIVGTLQVSAAAIAIDSRRHAAAHDPLHRQGRRREDLGSCLHRAGVRGGGDANAGDLHRSRAQPGGVARRGAIGQPTAGGEPALGAGGERPGGDGAPLVRCSGMARRAVARSGT
jgi:hypothetical protein